MGVGVRVSRCVCVCVHTCVYLCLGVGVLLNLF